MNTASFDYSGQMVSTDRNAAYKADRITINGFPFDLHSNEDIRRIPIPDFCANWDVTNNLAYIMKIRCGSAEKDVIPDMIEKTIQLMLASRICWRMGDYLQVIRNFYRTGLFDEGDMYESVFRSKHPEVFADLAAMKYEKEHESTKGYWRKKATRREKA